MGVYIKGMEMPRDKALSLVIYSDGSITVNLQNSPYKAIEIPTPHGRLIDADVCRQKVYDGSRTPYKTCPTVIEAEGE